MSILIKSGTLITAWGTTEELVKLGLPVPTALQVKFPFHTFLLIALSNVASLVCGYGSCMVLPDGSGGGAAGRRLWDMWAA